MSARFKRRAWVAWILVHLDGAIEMLWTKDEMDLWKHSNKIQDIIPVDVIQRVKKKRRGKA